MSDGFRACRIDHVELFVPDRCEAARWFERTLGLEIVREYEHHAKEGPLFISSDGGDTKLVLFEGKPRGRRETAGHHLVAFRVEGEDFVEFPIRTGEHPLYDDGGSEITERRAVDHGDCLSTYFCDPYGNRFEVTTCDHRFVREHL